MSDREKVRKRLDSLLRMHVLWRAQGRCERCGAIGGSAKGGKEGVVVLQVAHFKSRRLEATRWHLENVCCLCKGCHFMWAHHEPDQFSAWWLERIGVDGMERLNELWKKPAKREPLADVLSRLLSLDGVSEHAGREGERS